MEFFVRIKIKFSSERHCQRNKVDTVLLQVFIHIKGGGTEANTTHHIYVGTLIRKVYNDYYSVLQTHYVNPGRNSNQHGTKNSYFWTTQVQLQESKWMGFGISHQGWSSVHMSITSKPSTDTVKYSSPSII